MNSLIALTCCCIACWASYGLAQQRPETGDDGLVKTTAGLLKGTVRNFKGSKDRRLVTYFGVPYAESPTGDLRFRPPVKRKPWQGVYHAEKLSRACVQPLDRTFEGFWGAEMWNPNTEMDEDCLNLNIWVPYGAKNSTVLVWFFGGGFVSGSPSLEVYNADGLAADGNVIVVTPNYRVGAFGFLYLNHPDVPGNVGLLDQRLALEWVRDNIQALGGDPKKVTLFGESAGAASVEAHMVSPESHDLFTYGILQSGSLLNPWAMDSPERAMVKSKAVISAVECEKESLGSTLACLKALPAKNLADKLWSLSPSYFMEFPLAIVSTDRNFFKKDAFQAIRDGEFKKTNVIVGVQQDEGSYWMIYNLNNYFKHNTTENPINRKQYIDAVNRALDRESLVIRNAAVFQYDSPGCTVGPETALPAYTDAVSQIVGDYQFTCDSLSLADKLTKSGQKVYAYLFKHVSSANAWPKWGGAMHAYEIEFVFGLPIANRTHRLGSYSANEEKLSKDVIEYWTQFARTGTPKGTTDWPAYGQDRRYLVLDADGKAAKVVETSLKRTECDFWNEVTRINYHIKHSNRVLLSSGTHKLSFHFHCMLLLFLSTCFAIGVM